MRLFRTTGVVSLALLGAGAPSAAAGTLSMQDGLLRFEAAPGEDNSLYVLRSYRRPEGFSVYAYPTPVVGAGCELLPQPSGIAGGDVECSAGATRVAIDLGDGDDHGWVDPPLAGTIRSGGGSDEVSATGPAPKSKGLLRVFGGDGDDGLIGGEGDRMTVLAFGGPGDDLLYGSGRLYGGRGKDTFGSPGNKAKSVMVLGPGRDQVRKEEISDGFLDVVRARGGGFDTVECSDDTLDPDRVMLDPLDWSPGCEKGNVVRSGPARAVPIAFTPDLRLRQGPALFVTVGCPADAARDCSGVLRAQVPAGGSRRFRIRRDETRVVRVGRTPFCTVRRQTAARLSVLTEPRGLVAARPVAVTLNDPVAVDRIALPGGKRLVLSLEAAGLPEDGVTAAVVRRYSGCKLDTEFGTDGAVGLLWRDTSIPPPRTDFTHGWGQFVRMLPLPSGRVVLGGTVDYSSHGNCCPANLGLAAITPGGKIDGSFGEGGFAEADFLRDFDGWATASSFRAEVDSAGALTLVLEGDFVNLPDQRGRSFVRFTEYGELMEAHVTPTG